MKMIIFILILCVSVKCVTATTCPDPNAEFVKCPDPCPHTCDNWADTWRDPIIDCQETCAPTGCTCKSGYILDPANGQCVLPQYCTPKVCTANEQWNSCSDYCNWEKNCDGYLYGIRNLCLQPPNGDPSLIPCIGRCVCPSGYVRIKDKCTIPNQCCTEPNTKLVGCPVPCVGNCTYFPPTGCTTQCFADQLGSCICADGHVLNSLNKCIPLNQCPCSDPNAVFMNNPPPCPPTCEFLTGQKPCNRAGLAFGCTCKEGFVLDINGKCITKDKCPKICYKPNEEYLTCGSPCEPTCLDKNPKCKAKCGPGCFCKKGFVRDNGNCIPVKNCKC